MSAKIEVRGISSPSTASMALSVGSTADSAAGAFSSAVSVVAVFAAVVSWSEGSVETALLLSSVPQATKESSITAESSKANNFFICLSS